MAKRFTHRCVEIDSFQVGELYVSGEIEAEISIERDLGYYGGRTDDYPGDPDEISWEDIVTYKIWISDDPENEGVMFNHEQSLLNEEFLWELMPHSEDMEVRWEDLDDC